MSKQTKRALRAAQDADFGPSRAIIKGATFDDLAPAGLPQNVSDREESKSHQSFDAANYKHLSSSKELDSAYDRMCVQKYFPGTEVTPYVAGMNVIPSPSITFNSNSSETATEIIGSGSGIVNIGTGDYVILAFCPVLTILHGRGGIGQYPATEKLGGVIFNQSNSTGEPGIRASWFDETKYSRSMLDIYGSDTTGFAASGFVWSAEMLVSTLAPAANKVGTYYKGCVTMGQLQGTVAGLSIQDLIEIASESGTHQDSFQLRSAVVNHDVVFTGSGRTDQPLNLSEVSQYLQQELVTYVIFQRAVQNITTGQNSSYSLQMSVKGNCLFWPDARDSIANGMGKHYLQMAMPHGVRQVTPKLFAGHNVDYMVDTQASKVKGKTFLEKLKDVMSSAWENRSEILGAIGQVASLAAPFLLADEPTEQTIVRSCYQRRLLSLHADLAYFKTDPTISPLVDSVDFEINRRLMILQRPENTQRVVPVSIFDIQPQPSGQTPTTRRADHSTSRDALSRYGVERNPGPCAIQEEESCGPEG